MNVDLPDDLLAVMVHSLLNSVSGSPEVIEALDNLSPPDHRSG